MALIAIRRSSSARSGARSKRRAGGRSSSGRGLGAAARRANRGLGRFIAVLNLASLASVLAILHLLGPAPRFQPDAFWVGRHVVSVRFALLALMVAAGCLILSVLLRTQRLVVAGAWAIAAGLGAWMFSDRIVVISEQVIARFSG